MKALPEKDSESEIASSIHMEFIQNVAEYQNGDGMAEVESYHRAIFLNHYGKELERHQQQRRVQEDRLQYLDERLQQANKRLVDREKLVAVEEDGVPDVKPTQPWNAWDIGMFVAALLGIISLLTFGVLNISFNLLESGIVTFVEHPARAYFWAALLPVGALAVKIGWDLMRSTNLRAVYLWACLIAGIAGVLIWVAAYASVYPTLSQTTEEQIASLSVFDDGSGGESGFGGAKTIDMVIVAAQAVAEIFLSAVLGIYMTIIYARHRPVRLAGNPEFTQLDIERRQLEEQVAQTRMALADATGSEQKLQNQLSVFLSFARSLYQKEVALREDEGHQKRVLLDKVTEQFRSQLEEIGNGSTTSRKSLPKE